MTKVSGSPKMISRRTLLCAGLRISVLGLGALALPGCASSFGDWMEPGLGELARQKGRQYGAAVQSWQLDRPDFADALIREAGMLVPEWELKWNPVQPKPNEYNFSGYRKIAAFAR